GVKPVILGEPPRTQGDLNFSLLGFPVRVHPLFWLVTLMLGARNNDVPGLLSWIAAVFISILLHELGHAVVMRAYGYRPWITLYGMGGLASYNPGDAYNSRGPTTLGQIAISLAGPGAGFLLAALIIAGMAVAGRISAFFPHGAGWPWVMPYLIGSETFTYYLLYINIFWGLVNLLPVYPLDGGKVSQEIFLKFNSRDGIRQSLILSMITAGGLVAFALRSHDWYIALFFAYLGYSSYTTLQAYSHGRRW
ncbi:hypothetical protein LCGC14_3061790, partial [marine sediment metagenome]